MKTKHKFLISKGHCYIVKTKQYNNGHVIHEYVEMTSSTLYNRVKRYIQLKVSKAARFEKMKSEVKEYMKLQWEENCPSQYQKYFDEWFSNITDYQLHCFDVWRHNKMGPF